MSHPNGDAPGLDMHLVTQMSAVLSSLGAAAILAPVDGGLAWLSPAAADLLSLPAGSVQASCLAGSMRALLSADPNADHERLTMISADPHAVVTDWEWNPTRPVRHLRVTSFPLQFGSVQVRAWTLDDVSAERRALSRAESSIQRVALLERSLTVAQDSVEESEQKLRVALEGVLDPHLLVQLIPRDEPGKFDLIILVANQAALSYWGRSRNEVVGARLPDLLPRSDAAGVLDDITVALIQGRDAALNDMPFPGPSGEARHYDIRLSAMGGDQFALTWADVTARHEAARQVDEARRHFKLLAENASEVVLRSSVAGLLEWVSPSVHKVLGWDPSELTGRALSELVHSCDLEKMSETVAESMATPGRVCHNEARILDAHGGHRWMSITMKVAVDGAGSPIARICTWRDIESEVSVREALRERSIQHDAIARSATDALVSVAASGEIVQWNEAASTLFGYGQEEALGKRFDLVVPEGFRRKARGWLDDPHSAEVREATTHSYRMGLTRRDGTEFPADVTLAVWERGGVQHISGLVRDVTLQQQVLDDLEAARSELDEAQQLSSAGSWTYDPASGHCSWSVELRRIHGLHGSTGDLGEMTARLRDSGRALRAAVASVSDSGETRELTYEVDQPGGASRRVQARVAAVRDTRGRVRRLRGTAIDVTELHRAEEVRARRVAAHADYLARVEHTLRTHLSVVEGWSGILEASPDELDEETRSNGLGAIRRNASALVGHVKALMSESSQYALAEAIVVEPVDAYAVAADAVADYSGLSTRRVELDADAPVLALGSAVALDTVVRHLIENAIKFTAEDGLVEVVVRESPGAVEVVIRDDGPGLPDDVDLFVPFAKATDSAGHGLGLHVVRTLVEAMGGEVVGRNRHDRRGAEFVVSLRSAEADA